jgi:1-deoxy-D-xylulose-5-phosphate synthase
MCACKTLPVIFCIDRAGNVGDDGPTHHGMYDTAMLRPLPNITLLAPSSGEQLREMMHYYAINAVGPVGIRYPKGGIDGSEIDWTTLPISKEAPKTEQVNFGNDTAILSIGTMLKNCEKSLAILQANGIEASLYDAKIIKPADLKALEAILKNYNYVISVEDGSIIGGMGETLLELAAQIGSSCVIKNLGFTDVVIEHGTVDELFEKHGLDAKGIASAVLKMHQKEV